jgi:hypothetical protein
VVCRTFEQARFRFKKAIKWGFRVSMVGPTLIDIREHIDGLGTKDGQYYVRCGRTGDRPVPAAGTRFPDRVTARAAARATELYRSALRRYDPQLPYYDLIVCEAPSRSVTAAGDEHGSGAELSESLEEPAIAAGSTPERRDLVEFCHRVAGAVFETLSESGYDAVERAVMDAYFELAETVGDPDELCLCLLESMATEVDARLGATEQADLLADAAARLEPAELVSDPVDGTLAALRKRGLIEGYARSSASIASDGTTDTAVVRLSGYALSAREGRLPVLPVTVELCRQRASRPPASVHVAAVGDDWRLTVRQTTADGQAGLVNAPIHEDE